MNESILTSVKATLGLAEDYTAFDPEIILYINGVLTDLKQLGIGPPQPFTVVDKTATWASFVPPSLEHNNVQVYTSLRVRLMFDPPESSYAINSFQQQIDQLAWRIRERREEYTWPADQVVVYP